jgi:hypothetical protein
MLSIDVLQGSKGLFFCLVLQKSTAYQLINWHQQEQ